MKVFVNSVPKSGTYLISNFLSEIGFQNSNYHYNDNEYSDYNNPTLENARAFPENFRRELSFKESLKKLKHQSFAVGHIGVENSKYLKGFKVIFLYRNIENCSISFANWTYQSGRWKNYENDSSWRNFHQKPDFVKKFLDVHGVSLYTLFNKTTNWIDESDSLKVKFETIIGDEGRDAQIHAFEQVLNFLGIELKKKNLECIIANTLNRDSLTKVKTNLSKQYYKTDDFIRTTKKLGFQELNKRLGYNVQPSFFKKLFGNSRFKPHSLFYNKYWKQNKTTKTNWSYGINIVDKLIDHYEFTTVLDAGCGTGDVVRYLKSRGYDAFGIEISDFAVNTHAKDLVKQGLIKIGSLKNLPYADNQFDVVFSSEVLEHIHEHDIPAVVNELVRVTKKYLFLTISLRPSSNFNRYHCTLKSRSWWQQVFEDTGVKVNESQIEKLQKKKSGYSNHEVLMSGPTKSHIHEMQWFIEDQPYSLNGEMEPWYFIFEKNE